MRSSFEKSYKKVKDNLAWFNRYANGISQWALKNQEQVPQTTATETTSTTVMSTASPVTVNQTSTETSTSAGTSSATELSTASTIYILFGSTVFVHTSCIMLVLSASIAFKAFNLIF